MSNLAIVGTQWGDEGKGKLIDYLAAKADMVVRSQGGNNAGHTVVIEGQKYSLHLIPSGVLRKSAINIIANGVVFDIEGFFNELKTLADGGIEADKVFVSDRAHVVFPYHRKLDELLEKSRGAEDIGTTKRGIGPAYMDKVQRSGIRVCDMLELDDFKQKLEFEIDAKNRLFEKYFDAEPMNKQDMVDKYMEFAKRIVPYVADTSLMIYQASKEGKNILFEGAQGALLDLDLGTYPYVTSSHPTTGGFTVGSGIGAGVINEAVGIVKAYTTRVGKGPFVTELFDEVGDEIRKRGREYGTTTGRPRRCGWFDAVIVSYSVRVNGLTSLSLMLLDVLDTFDEIKLCYAYEIDGEIVKEYPASLKRLERAIPQYITVRGWNEDLTKCTKYDELPENAKLYIEEIEKLVGVGIKIVSVGPGREQTIVREEIF